MVFLIILVVAWTLIFLPTARRAKWTRPAASVQRYRSGMRMVAPRTEYEIRRATAGHSPSEQKLRARRRDVVVFLGTGAAFAGLAATLSDAAAWPVCITFVAMLLLYAAAVNEADRRKAARRVAARRLQRQLRPQAESVDLDYAEAV